MDDERTMVTTSQAEIESRRRTARVLANSPLAELTQRWAAWADHTEVEHLRGPEAGLVMVQGRTGGTGDRFNLGEATVTRATVAVRLTDSEPTIGTAYVLGSYPEHAELAAIFDALLNSDARERVLSEVIAPLENALHDRDAQAHREARSTVVDFLTVARENSGNDEDEDE